MANIYIKGMDKAAILIALYNAAKPQGLGHLHYTQEPLSRERAVALLEQNDYLDYVNGRVLKIHLTGDTLSTALYDRDNGAGAAERALRAAGLLAVHHVRYRTKHSPPDLDLETQIELACTAERERIADWISKRYAHSTSYGHLAMLAEDIASAVRKGAL